MSGEVVIVSKSNNQPSLLAGAAGAVGGAMVAAGFLLVGAAAKGVREIISYQEECARIRAAEKAAEIDSFRECAAFLADKAARESGAFWQVDEGDNRGREGFNKLLSRALLHQELAKNLKITTDLSGFITRLQKDREKLDTDAAVLRRRAEQLNSHIESIQNCARKMAAQKELASKTQKELEKLGYTCVTPFPTPSGQQSMEARFRLPHNGELLRVKIKPEGKLIFRLCREGEGDEVSIGKAATERFREQEKLFCRHVPYIFKGLKEHGFLLEQPMVWDIPEEKIQTIEKIHKITLEDSQTIRDVANESRQHNQTRSH